MSKYGEYTRILWDVRIFFSIWDVCSLIHLIEVVWDVLQNFDNFLGYSEPLMLLVVNWGTWNRVCFFFIWYSFSILRKWGRVLFPLREFYSLQFFISCFEIAKILRSSKKIKVFTAWGRDFCGKLFHKVKYSLSLPRTFLKEQLAAPHCFVIN